VALYLKFLLEPTAASTIMPLLTGLWLPLLTLPTLLALPLVWLIVIAARVQRQQRRPLQLGPNHFS